MLVFPSRQSANGFRKTDINLQCASQQSHYHPLFLLQLRYLAKISPTSGNCGKLTALRCPIAVCSLLLYLIQRFIVLCKTFALSSEALYKEQYISALRIMQPFYCKVLVGGSYRYCPDVDGLKVHCNTFILMTHVPTLR